MQTNINNGFHAGFSQSFKESLCVRLRKSDRTKFDLVHSFAEWALTSEGGPTYATLRERSRYAAESLSGAVISRSSLERPAKLSNFSSIASWETKEPSPKIWTNFIPSPHNALPTSKQR